MTLSKQIGFVGMKRQLWTFTVLGLLTQMLSFPGHVEAQNEASDYGIQEVAEINRLIRQGWSDYEIRPLCSCRR